jgi:predicted ribosomally synthesized peptide with nif11-like leader
MAHESARQFVERMRMDQEFRREVTATADTSAFQDLVHRSGYAFSERDLVGAMASCMEEMGRMPPRG